MEMEILFTVEKNTQGGFSATSANGSLSAQGTSIEEVKLNAWDAVICKYEGQVLPLVEFAG
jgi:hypothetical protein